MNEEGHNRRCPDMLLSYWGRKDSGQGGEWCEVSSRSIQLSVSTTARPLGVKLSCVVSMRSIQLFTSTAARCECDTVIGSQRHMASAFAAVNCEGCWLYAPDGATAKR